MKTNDSKTTPPAGVPGRVTFLDGRGDLPMLEISTRWSTAEIYLHGAHVTHFKRHGEPPLLFLSQCSRFEPGRPIRGGAPIIFPWFGPREGVGQHGFVRNQAWELKKILPAADGGVSVRFRFPKCPEAAMFPSCLVEYVVTVNEELTLELIVTNLSASDPLEFENCLHTYFTVGDISAVSVTGLQGVSYLDNLANLATRVEPEKAIRFASEVDRVYFDTAAAVEIRDEKLGRVIRVEKDNSASTVVWNPWITKAQQMADFGDAEYRSMVCVESGNVKSNKTILPPGGSSTLKVKLSSAALK